MILIFIIGVLAGMVVDNLYAPKIRLKDGSLTVEWTNKKKTP